MNHNTLKVYSPSVPFVFGELFGGSEGMQCEHGGCKNKSYFVWMTQEEKDALPQDRGEACIKICREKIGIVLCDDHDPLSKNEAT